MNILVCMKAVPSTGQVEVDGQFKLQRSSAKLEWNIADQAALEAALQLKAESDTVTVISMGPKKLEESMIPLLARGADRCVLVTDPAFAGSDTYATANVLARSIRHLGAFDLILCGRRAIDGETGQVPGMLATALAIPCVTNAEKLEKQSDSLCVTRRLEQGTYQLVLPSPGLVSVCEYTYSLRLPGILGMRRARNKTVELLTQADLGCAAPSWGLSGSLTKVIAMDSKFPGLRKGPICKDTAEGIATILSMLKEVE